LASRRMFNEALQNDEARASYALEQIQQLYAVEKGHKRARLILCGKKNPA